MHDRRLNSLAEQLTVQQLVLASIKAMQSHDSIRDYAKWLVLNSPDRTICEIIEASVRARCRGGEEDDIRRAIRRAVREGVFLTEVARQCTFAIIQSEECFRLRLFGTQLMLENLLLREQAGEARDQELHDSIAAAMRALVARCRGYELAVNAIEREYFEGASILSADAQRLLQERLADMGPWRAHLRGAPGPEDGAGRDAAQDFVYDWVRTAKAATHQAMGEDADAADLMAEALGV